MRNSVIDIGLMTQNEVTALHESAHAVTACRLDVPVRCLALGSPQGVNALYGYTRCDWEEPRAKLNDDRCLCKNGFAIAYAGAVLEKKIGLGDESLSRIKRHDEECTDFKQIIQPIRKCLAKWLGFSLEKIQEVENDGCKCACKLVSKEMSCIKRLAKALFDQQYLDENAIRNWFINDCRMIRARAFFLWENKTGKLWWDSMSNWIEAEEQETLLRLAKPDCSGQ